MITRKGNFNFDKKIKEWNKEKKEALKEIKDESLSFFQKNYAREGFVDQSFRKWKPKKWKNRKPTLVDTGLLKKSFKTRITGNKIFIWNPIFYGRFHNLGTSKLPQRKFLGNSKVLEKANLKRIVKRIKKVLT